MLKKIAFATMAISGLLTTNFADKAHLGSQAYSNIIDNNGRIIGHAKYTQGSHGVLIHIKAGGLPSGKHGMHFHHVGTCEDTSAGFKLAGGHIMPSGKPHGFLNPEGPHEGNLPNLIVHRDGTVETEVYTELVSLHGTQDQPALLDSDGSTLIIHAQPDDHFTQPIGGSGGRIGCGVIRAEN